MIVDASLVERFTAMTRLALGLLFHQRYSARQLQFIRTNSLVRLGAVLSRDMFAFCEYYLEIWLARPDRVVIAL